jgi:hypothetical protein
MPIQPLICPHLIEPATCPVCAQARRDEHEAITLAAQDYQTVDQWRREFEAWVDSSDATFTTAGEPVTEVMA